MPSPHSQHSMPYRHLAIMLALSFVAMFAFMYAMVDRWANVYLNLNQAYMAGLMVAPMAVIELAVMRAMYPDRKLNLIVIGASMVLLLLCWFGIRGQAGIGDKEFLKSMIPHHAGAILMCGKADVRDAEIQRLCGNIITSQQQEIAQMKAILRRLQSQSPPPPG